MDRCLLGMFGLFLLCAEVGRAELKKLEILRREPFAGGMAFGEVGPYEKIVGVAHFAVDPAHPRNKIVVDLSLAPRNADGKVEFQSDVFILAPKDPTKGNRAILYDVNNRGNKLALGFFNRGGGGNDPTTAADAGDGFLFRRGYTVVWCGWIGELLPGNNRLLMKTPVVTDNGKPIRGLVRFEMVTDSPAETLPLSRREGHGSYPPTAKGEAEGVLTWRMRESDTRVPIPRSQWSLERMPIPNVDKGVPGSLPQIRMRVAGGFRPGNLYELVCEAEGPIVQGLGFAAVRDLVSFLRYSEARNGKPGIERAYGFGVSQSGRFLRNFLYLGFNADEKDRKVFDGLMPHVAGGGLGFFNFRFAQPTRHNAQHEEHLYPADYFPFTYGEETDPFSKKSDAILKRLKAEGSSFLPKVMHTQSAAEYWHRSGSLVHTDPLGTKDADIPENVRIYAFGGTQHGPAGDPPSRGIADNLANPGDYKPQLRALLDALDTWVRDDKPPPASVYPRIDNGTLVDWRQKGTGFPALPGLRYPEVIQQPPFADHGQDFFTHGIATVEPPRVLGHYTVKVPKNGPDGNDLGTLLPPEVAVPLATYTGWNMRHRDAGAEGMLVSLTGSYIPFPKTAAERKAGGDPRPSIEERYGSFEEYRKQFAEKCKEMVKDRYLLEEDAERLIAGREKRKELFAAAPAPNPLLGAKALTEEGDFAAKMVDGIHKYLDRALAASIEDRKQFWKRDFSSAEAYVQSVESNRERLKRILGVVDDRLPVRELEYVGDTGQSSLVCETDKFKVHAVRWPVLPGVAGEGLLLEPKQKPLACVVAIPHAAWTPEMISGLASGLPSLWHSARMFAENGCRVLVPTLINRKETWSGNPLIRMTNEPHREFLYRMLYQQGRHLIGLELQKILAAVDWFARERDHPPIVVHGFGEGGMLALFSGALDSRIAIIQASSHCGPREGLWQEPIDRNVWGFLREFGDAEVASLISSRHLVIDAVPGSRWLGPTPATNGRVNAAAPGRVEPVSRQDVTNQADAIKNTFKLRRTFVDLDDMPAWSQLLLALGVPEPRQGAESPLDGRKHFDPDFRLKRQFDQLVSYTQRLVRESESRRAEFWKKADPTSLDTWKKSTEFYRDYFHEEIIGKLPPPTLPMNPRIRPAYDEPKRKGYEVMLDLYPDVFCYGVLLLPKDLKPGERRPVVVCQHGLEGRPRDVVDPRHKSVYNSFGAQLANKGYIVFAPQNPYIGGNHFRQINRKANPLKLSMFSFIVRQHERILDWLAGQPFVDPERIGFYGLSYGGETAMRVPSILPRYCLSICSADFNNFAWKTTTLDFAASYMLVGTYEIFDFDMNNTFSHAEMAYLIAPRPFMVERGHDDGVGLDEWVAYEYAKVRRLYSKLKIPERTEIEFFDGGHVINGKGTFAFLQKHLGWPN